MADIKWVVVQTPNVTRGAELKFAEAELARHLPANVKWCCASNVGGHDISEANPTDLVLLIKHPWITLDSRCLDLLRNSLISGYDVVEACDSGNSFPMQSPDYATLRGMERYVDAHGLPSVSRLDVNGGPAALLRLMTVGALNRGGDAELLIGRVAGAYLHDVSGYYSGDRSEVIAMIPDAARVCLDVGGGLGNFLKLSKSQLGVETHLVELDPEIAEQARVGKCADFVTSGDFLQYSGSTSFDCVTFLDMLEHVEDPEQYLRHSRGLLSDNGVVIASIPNVGHWSVVVDLLEGRWDYAPAGIQCITHLRFFTLKSILDLFDRSGFVVERTEPVIVPCPERWNTKLRVFDDLSLDVSGLNTYSYLVVGRPAAE